MTAGLSSLLPFPNTFPAGSWPEGFVRWGILRIENNVPSGVSCVGHVSLLRGMKYAHVICHLAVTVRICLPSRGKGKGCSDLPTFNETLLCCWGISCSVVIFPPPRLNWRNGVVTTWHPSSVFSYLRSQPLLINKSSPPSSVLSFMSPSLLLLRDGLYVLHNTTTTPAVRCVCVSSSPPPLHAALFFYSCAC